MTRSAACASDVRFAPSLSTGKERDSESGNDYFGARYYASTMGRWLSPDWSAKVEPVPYAKLDNPQSFHLYSYVGNNPLSRFDIDGHVNPSYWCDQDANSLACGVQHAWNQAHGIEDHLSAQQQNGASSSSSKPSDPIVNALEKDVPGVTKATAGGPP